MTKHSGIQTILSGWEGPGPYFADAIFPVSNPERWTGATRNWDPQTIVRLNSRLRSLKAQINDETAAEEKKLAA